MGVTVGFQPTQERRYWHRRKSSQTEGGGEQGQVNTGQPSPTPASLKPRQLQTSNPARLQSPAQLATAHSLASAFFLHPEPTQGTKPVQVVPWQLDGQLAPAHNQGLNR